LNDGKARPLFETPASGRAARFSPDGRWIAYQSDQSGRFEAFVRAFPGPSRSWQVSIGGGESPAWARSGRELFFRSGDAMMAVDVTATAQFSAGRPRRLFSGQYAAGSFDVGPDGRFLMIKPEPQPVTHLTLVQNWGEEVRRRVRPLRGKF
jgi:Tol biopolymer transport system component